MTSNRKGTKDVSYCAGVGGRVKYCGGFYLELDAEVWFAPQLGKSVIPLVTWCSLEHAHKHNQEV